MFSRNFLCNSKLMVQKWRMEIWLFSHVSPCSVSNSWSSMLIRSVPIFKFICTIIHFSWYLLDKRPSFGIWPYLYHTCVDMHPILSHGCEFGSNRSVLLWPIYLSSFSRLFAIGLFIPSVNIGFSPLILSLFCDDRMVKNFHHTMLDDKLWWLLIWFDNCSTVHVTFLPFSMLLLVMLFAKLLMI